MICEERNKEYLTKSFALKQHPPEVITQKALYQESQA